MRIAQTTALWLGMSPRRRGIAGLLYAANGLVSVGLGAVYLFSTSFMPYHAEALGKSWAQLEPAAQTLLLALMQVAGAGWAVVGVLTVVIVAIPFRRNAFWARLAAPAALLAFYVPTLLATLDVLRATPAAPPWYGNAIACGVTLLGLGLDRPWQGELPSAQRSA